MRIPAITILAVTCLVGVASAQVHTNDMPGTRNPTGDRPQLSENASGAEAALVERVRQKLASDTELRDEAIKVEGNERREITLTGTVTSTQLRARAEDLARHVADVQDVENELTVGSPIAPPRNDSMTRQGKPATE
jgi:osmotically-inducible protein OsmY